MKPSYRSKDGNYYPSIEEAKEADFLHFLSSNRAGLTYLGTQCYGTHEEKIKGAEKLLAVIQEHLDFLKEKES